MKTCIIIGAGGRGKDSYAPIIKKNNLFSIIGVADPDRKKREEFKKTYNIPDEMCFDGYHALFRHKGVEPVRPMLVKFPLGCLFGICKASALLHPAKTAKRKFPGA